MYFFFLLKINKGKPQNFENEFINFDDMDD